MDEKLEMSKSAEIDISEKPQAVCPECGPVALCDEDRCCLGCGCDLIVVADAGSADALIYALDELRSRVDTAVAAERTEVARLHAKVQCLERELACLRDLLLNRVRRLYGDDVARTERIADNGQEPWHLVILGEPCAYAETEAEALLEAIEVAAEAGLR